MKETKIQVYHGNEIQLMNLDEFIAIISEDVKPFITSDILKRLKESEWEYVQLGEVMKKLNIGKTTVYKYINKGLLKPKKFGSRTLFKVSEIIELLESKKV